ncbi:MAG: helix-turn-helix domain-containing protein [Bacteroidales bacterium]|nr:helix-turn-helix domain-containing protein [Lachnoclostridium sp.]MCM1385269.1 helix-turn-helix domain-containing protein [Lachnoclostridium sp.]MCM1466145.1 helix-turn-helix domain-containing protein [Bacteroidales bacterium]
MCIYNKIKDICKQKGVSVSSVEKRAGLANGLITKWNTFNPTVKSLKAVADVLEVTVDELLKESG